MAEALLDTFLNCPVCLDVFTEPVTLGCHHSFCSSCLRDYWDQNKTRTCPVCRRRSSKELTDVNFALKELALQFREKTTAQRPKDQESPAHSQPEQRAVCSKHPEVPPLFCKDEGRALCPVCELSQHQRHTVVSVEEVQEELKEQLRSELETFTKQRDRFVELENTYKEIQEHCDLQGALCESQIRALFSRLHQFLTEEEHRAMEALREEQQRQAQTMGPELGRLREQLASVEHTVQELKGLLQRDTVLHYSPQRPLQPTPALGPGLLIDQAKVLGNLGFRVWRRMRSEVSYSPVLLDPNTASHMLYVSEDLRGVRFEETEQVPDNPERFNNYPIVLGSEGFSSGAHQWDVEVGDHPCWAVGLVKESVQRKEESESTPENGFWCLGHYKGTYFDVFNKQLTLKRRPERIRVKLDYDRGRLTFSDPDHMTQICSYKRTFTEKVFPVFLAGEADEAKTEEIQICLSDGPTGKV